VVAVIRGDLGCPGKEAEVSERRRSGAGRSGVVIIGRGGPGGVWRGGLSVLVAAGLVFAAAPAIAIGQWVTSSDLARCDPLAVPNAVDELGNLQPPFPNDELIASGDSPTPTAACPPFDDLQQPNVEVSIQNLTPFTFTEVWYVADPETAISNADGLVNGELAFHIDTIGMNQPLIFESILGDQIFQPNEVWTFIVDDYSNALGLPASAFGSVGVGSFSSGDAVSSGSIIAIVPEPATLSMLVLGLAGLALRARA